MQVNDFEILLIGVTFYLINYVHVLSVQMLFNVLINDEKRI